ncbi:hypothetical protein FB45DRAFT_908302 [Roridomyces roridus]|uniref:R3H domain-containing protein n=1 Tax=Roridomyces roridus TaxID=1738132 RepID=A0AAD7C2M8_9AGAR|nr:hypothetical protein FB45DRAFT_908302 [Roridomyces roridus]
MEGPDNPARPSTAELPVPEPKPGRNNNRRNNQRPQDTNGSSPSHQPHGLPRNSRPQHENANVNSDVARHSDNWRAHSSEASSAPPPPRPRGRGAKFNSGLTSPDATSSAPRAPKPKPKPAPVADDLTSILTAALSTPPTQQYCWTTFHLKCIRSWAAKSVKEVADAWAARGEPQRGGEWRCPGCQARRPHHESLPLIQCASPCTRTRPTCSHPCPLLCHPGPCPPCRITTDVKCGCLKGTILALRCGETNISCACGAHKCERECHTDSCDPCAVREQARCWCGKEEREVACGAGDPVKCTHDAVAEPWHRCARSCHPASGPPSECPRSPAHCTAPIPTCKAQCSRILACGHACPISCHEGECPPCSEPIVRPCRCGATSKKIPCSVAEGENGSQEVLCEKPCAALRACGRHRCLRLCCPLASVAALQQKSKGKKRAVDSEAAGVGEERGGLHECDLVCGKMLSCGEHRCEEKDHKGPCPPCLRSSFEELICPCGRTVLEPPIPCGTRIQCSYQCPRPAPTCGHPRTQHICHDDEVGCPPCPFLTTKRCMCGKKEVGNVRCAQERVSCADEDCGACALPCGKPRKLCFPLRHPCTQPCHAPAGCDESAPCTAIITVSCARFNAGKSVANPIGRESQQPKCTNECLIAKRNARLADALGISQDTRDRGGPPVLAFARANPKFVSVVEKAFADFVASEKKMQVLPHMPPDRRKFVHDVAAIYRMDTQMVDQEPHRSVQLLRRFDTKVPSPLLSAALAAAGPPPSLGKLADLRTANTAGASWRAAPAKPTVAPAPRAWGASSTPLTPPTVTPPPPPPPPPTVQAPVPVAPVAATPSTPADVPEDWEDDGHV